MIRTFIVFIGLIFLAGAPAKAWGPTGHRIVGQVASDHLTPAARQALDSLLDGESLAMASNWMDFIRSDDKYDSLRVWHYATIPDGMVYQAPEDRSNGLLIEKLHDLLHRLHTGKFKRSEKFALKCVIHLIGDLHQPLHVGNGTDRGGNGVRVRWFGDRTSLHVVWDTKIIRQERLSYTEYSNYLDRIKPSDKMKWEKGDIDKWARENVQYRKSIYDIPVDGKLSYHYIFQNLHILELRLQQAGIRLASILNELYDKTSATHEP